MIVLAPSSVQEMYDLTFLAFDLSDKYRNPAMILGDALLCQLKEPLLRRKPGKIDITNVTTTTFDVYLDDDRLEEYANLNLTPDDDFFVEIYNNGVFLGVATFQGPDPGVADNSRWEITTAVGNLQEGHNNFITAAVRIRDEADPRVIGRGAFSPPLQVTLDTIAPSGTAHLFPYSDSGIWGFDETMSDLVTSDLTPLLYGAAEANALVRVALDRDPLDTTDPG